MTILKGKTTKITPLRLYDEFMEPTFYTGIREHENKKSKKVAFMNENFSGLIVVSHGV